MYPTEIVNIPEMLRDELISVLLPFYKEEPVIVENTRKVLNRLTEFGLKFELVLVDDGSPDHGTERLREAFPNDPRVKIIRNARNFGKGWALKTAYEFSKGSLVLFLDSDLELSPDHLPNFLKVMDETGADAVIGSKLHPDSVLEYPPIRRLISLTYYTFVKIAFGLPLSDTQTGIKLFRRESLELAMPKVLVKKFAFDIELLNILHKNKKKIVSAPIVLNFSRGKFGNIRFKTLWYSLMDTLAVLYRDRILGFYNRPMGRNIQFTYTFVLFSRDGGGREKEHLMKYLQLSDPALRFVVSGPKVFDIGDGRLTCIETQLESRSERLSLVREKVAIQSDYVVFSDLDSYPDERLLLPLGRILSLPGTGGAGGFMPPRPEASQEELISYIVLSSFFMNLSLSYRYKPSNFREVSELHLHGMIVRSSLVKTVPLIGQKNVRLESLLSSAVRASGEKIYYSPDMMIYHVYPESPKELHRKVLQDGRSRAFALKARLFGKSHVRVNKLFIAPLALILVFGLSILSVLVWKNLLPLLVIAAYYLFLWFSRVLSSGFRKGSKVFVELAICQWIYSLSFVRSLFVKPLI